MSRLPLTMPPSPDFQFIEPVSLLVPLFSTVPLFRALLSLEARRYHTPSEDNAKFNDYLVVNL